MSISEGARDKAGDGPAEGAARKDDEKSRVGKTKDWDGSMSFSCAPPSCDAHWESASLNASISLAPSSLSTSYMAAAVEGERASYNSHHPVPLSPMTLRTSAAVHPMKETRRIVHTPSPCSFECLPVE
jgi:hypothetical protein